MCMVYLLAALPRLREVGRGEPLRHQNQTAVYVYVCVFVCVWPQTSTFLYAADATDLHQIIL